MDYDAVQNIIRYLYCTECVHSCGDVFELQQSPLEAVSYFLTAVYEV